MDREALLTEFWRQADDSVEPHNYSEEDATRWANEAEREACIRSRLLFDDTSDFLAVDIESGVVRYDLDPRVLVIEAAYFVPTVGRRQELDLVGMDALRERDPRLCRTGRPCKLVHSEPRAVRLWPIPTAANAGQLQFAVYRLPANDLEQPDDEPEIDEAHHAGLIDWMLYRAYGTKDAEFGDDKRAQERYDDFEARFGERPTADVQRRHRERHRNTTRVL